MKDDKALAQFVSTDERTARQAYDCLAASARSFLRAYLARTTGLSSDQREDIVQDVLLRFWGVRSTYENSGEAAWHGWLKATARRCCVDLYRRTQGTVSLDGSGLEEAIPETAAEPLAAVMDALDAETLHHHADVLWLGLDPTLPYEAHTRRLLAAQLLYLDRLPWETVRRLIGSARPGEAPLSREELDTWLSHDGVLRHLAYHTLRYGNDRLAGFLLCLPDPPDPAVLDELTHNPVSFPFLPRVSRPAPDASEWTSGEVAAILWRYRYGLLFDHILQRADCVLDANALQSLIDRTLALFPFHYQMETLLSVLGARGRRALASRGLWQRLAFAYCYGDGLPHKDIQDRTQPAYRHVADTAQPEITLGMLNVWLSNGRLLKSLARICQGGSATEADSEVGHV